MTKFFSTALFVNILIASFAQTKKPLEIKRDTLRYCSGRIISIVETDEKGDYHGKTTRFFRTGKISEIEAYQHGELEGQSVYFYEMGDTSMTIDWKNGVQQGKRVAYYPNGKKMFAEYTFGGMFTGQSLYLDTNGLPYNGNFRTASERTGVNRVREVTCTEGRPEGEMRIYEEESCKLLMRVPMKNGIVDGRVYSYQTNPEHPSVSLYENGKYIKEDDSLYRENVRVYRQYLRGDSSNSSILYFKALAHLRVGEKKSALKDLESVIKLDPSNYKAYYNHGVLLGDSVQSKAISDFKKCVELKPDFYLAHYNLGYLFFQQINYKLAIPEFQQVLKYKPDYMPAINYLALIYDFKKDKKKADYYWKMADEVESKIGK
jgi:antitoxin component YwqK of YwqJK toxin-antitoxin module